MKPAPSRGIGQQIVAELRGQIIAGELVPGDRLPANTALCERFGVSSLTASRAVRQLIDDGYLRSVRRSGVFVNHCLPFASRYGIAFHSHPMSQGNWNQMDNVILAESRRTLPGQDYSFVPYHNIASSQPGQEFSRLAADIAARRIGGLIFTTHPWQLYGLPCFADRSFPKAAIMKSGERTDLDAIGFQSFLGRAFDWLAAHGRQRLAVVSSSTLATQPKLELDIIHEAAGHGLEVRPHWLQFGDIGHPASARQIVHLLLATPAAERPDALIVADDNLLAEAELGVLAAGLTVPDELLVVAHCNFPQNGLHRIPVTRIGYDIHALLAQTVHRFRTAWPSHPGGVIQVPPVWEWEFEARRAQALFQPTATDLEALVPPDHSAAGRPPTGHRRPPLATQEASR